MIFLTISYGYNFSYVPTFTPPFFPKKQFMTTKIANQSFGNKKYQK